MSEELPQVLIVVDVQKGFVTPHSQHVITPLANLQYEFDHVVFTKFYNSDPSPFRKILGYDRMAAKSPETELALQPREDAVVFSRPIYSCVTETLLVRLKTWGVREVFIAGIATEACVLKSVLDLFELNIRPWVLEDLCASDMGVEYHDPAIKVMSRLIGAQHIIKSTGPEAFVGRT